MKYKKGDLVKFNPKSLNRRVGALKRGEKTQRIIWIKENTLEEIFVVIDCYRFLGENYFIIEGSDGIQFRGIREQFLDKSQSRKHKLTNFFK